jgi:hypothetical protein
MSLLAKRSNLIYYNDLNRSFQHGSSGFAMTFLARLGQDIYYNYD